MTRYTRLVPRLALGIMILALTAGCSAADDFVRSASDNVGLSVRGTLDPPGCSNGSGLIGAQSVPSATLVPCLTPFPTGWEIETVQIDQDGTKVVMDSDRAGDEAAIFRFVAHCDVGPAISTPTDQVESATSERIDTERFEHIEQVAPSFKANRYYLFDGGCVWWQFDFDQDATAALSVELGNSLVFVTRKQLNDNVREQFIDAEI